MKFVKRSCAKKNRRYDPEFRNREKIRDRERRKRLRDNETPEQKERRLNKRRAYNKSIAQLKQLQHLPKVTSNTPFIALENGSQLLEYRMKIVTCLERVNYVYHELIPVDCIRTVQQRSWEQVVRVDEDGVLKNAVISESSKPPGTTTL